MSNVLVIVLVAFGVLVLILMAVFFAVGLRMIRTYIADLDVRFTKGNNGQDFERQLGRTLDQSLGGLGQRVHESLARQSSETAQNLATLREKLGAIDQAQQQFRDLGQHVIDLKEILGNRQARGVMGEMQLEHLLRQVLPKALYDVQVKLENGCIADCLLHFPNPPGAMVVDAKFPLEGYRNWLEATEDAKPKALQQFGYTIKKHIDNIADRYILPGSTADYALMFLPAEAVYAEIFASLHATVEHGFKRKVFLVSPSTLMATLTTVRGIVRDVQLQKQSAEVQRLVGLVMQDVVRLGERVGKLRSHFDQTQSDIGAIESSMRRIVSRAEKIEQIGIQDDQDTD